MNFLDIVLICIVAIFLVRGFIRGLVQEVISLGAIILAIYLASNYHHLLIPHLEMYIKNEITVGALSYVVIFFGIILICWLFAKLIKSVLSLSLLGWIDRTTGALFGAIEGVLVGIIILIFMQSFAPKSTWLTESYLAPRSQHLVKLAGEYAPESMRDTLKSKGFVLPTPEEAMNSAKSMVDSATDAVGLGENPTE